MATHRPQKRRKQHVPDSAGLDWAMPTGSSAAAPTLSVTGLACTLFESADFDPTEHLIPWLGDADTLVDRFDGRLLLESLQSRVDSFPQLPPEGDEATEEELDQERYGEMDYSRESELAHIAGWFNPEAAVSSDEEEKAGSDKAAGHFAAVGFSYGNSEEQPAAEEEPFVPHFAIPEGLFVPEGARQHKIMVQTAKFVRGAGRQSVFVLRVKQASNPNFTFLMPQDRLHPYFEWLLDADLQAIEAAQAEAAASKDKSPDEAGGALGLLSAYEDDRAASPESSPQPPPEIRAIIGKLVAFIQGNPRFGFLWPGNQDHEFYRAELSKAIGESAAAEILPAVGSGARPSGGLGEGNAATSVVKPDSQQQAAAKSTAALRANPSLVKVALRPVTREKALAAAPAAEAEETAAAEAAGSQASAHGKPSAAEPSQPARRPARADELELPEASDRPAAAAAADEEERKARRRRLARQLMLSKQRQQSQRAEAPVRRITDHRSAFLAEEDGGGAAEGQAVEANSAAQPAKPQALPDLDELLRAKRAPPANVLSEFEVLGKEAGSHLGEDASRDPGSPRRRHKRRSSSSDSSGSDSKRRRRRRSSSRERRRRERKHKSKGRDKRPRRTPVEPVPSAEAPEVMEARIRAMLRNQQ